MKNNNQTQFSTFELDILQVVNGTGWFTSGLITNMLTSRCREKVHELVKTTLEDLVQKNYIARQQTALCAGQTDIIYEYRITDEARKLIA